MIGLFNNDGTPYTSGTKIVKGATRILFESPDFPSDRSYFYDPSRTTDNSPIGYSLFLVDDNSEVERVVFDRQGLIIPELTEILSDTAKLSTEISTNIDLDGNGPTMLKALHVFHLYSTQILFLLLHFRLMVLLLYLETI